MALATRTETEVKLRVASPEDARALLHLIGAETRRGRHLEDNLLFDHPSLRLAEAGVVLRLRRTDREGWLTYKGPRHDHDGMKSRREIETTVGDPDRLQEILETLGFTPTFRYQKYRESYGWRGAEIEVDETPLGAFLEIEGPPAVIHEAAAALGRGPADYLSESYPGLWWAAGRTGDMLFP
jgi:adenylate cyclase class 2